MTDASEARITELASPSGFVARSARPEDLPEMARVIEAGFDRWPPVETAASAFDYLDWKLSAPDSALAANTAVVSPEGKVVAAKLRWRGRAQLWGSEYVTDTGADFAVDPGYRGLGLGRLMNDFEHEGDRPSGTISMEPSPRNEAVVHMHILGAVQPVTIWVRPLTLRSRVANELRHGGPVAAARRAVARVRGRSRPASGRVYEVADLERFDARTDALWEAAREGFDFSRIRDAAYLNWRYADPRGGPTDRFAVYDGDGALAFAVFRPAGRLLHLLDTLTHPDHREAASAVLEAGVDLGRAAAATAIIAWLPPGHPDEPALEAAGYLPTGGTMEIEHKPPRGVDAPFVREEILRPGIRRHTTMGDFDFA